MRFRKKPVVIEAERFYIGEGVGTVPLPLPFSNQGVCCWDSERWYVQTLEGPLTISNGDWIIKGVKGEFYLCKPDIFEATYEPVEA